jgi:predicted porin
VAVAQVTSAAPTAGVASNTGITLYGRLDETIMNSKYSSVSNATGGVVAGEIKKGDIYSPGNAIGVRGREDLGGGTAAWFQLEAGAWPDGRLDSAASTGSHFGGRNSGIGVSSGLGDIMLGIWDTPYKQTMFMWNSLTSGGFSSGGIIMGNGDTTGALNNVLCTNTVSNASGSLASTAANSVCVTESTANNTAFSRRVNNSIQYWSPVFSGLQFKLMTAMANYKGSTSNNNFPNGVPSPKEYSGNITWARGPISLGLGADMHQGLRANTVAGGKLDTKDTAVMLGAKWNFGIGEVGVAYEKISYGDNSATAVSTKMDVPSYVVNGRFNVGPGALWGSYSTTPGGKSCNEVGSAAAANGNTIGGSSCGIEAKMATIGYDYILSKRTKMYAAYSKIDNGLKFGTQNVGTSYYYIAGPAANVGVGGSGGLVPGTDVTTFGLGLQHIF